MPIVMLFYSFIGLQAVPKLIHRPKDLAKMCRECKTVPSGYAALSNIDIDASSEGKFTVGTARSA